MSSELRRMQGHRLGQVEGDLDVKVTITDGVVTDAWTEAAMFRGFEIILRGKDPQAAEGWRTLVAAGNAEISVHAHGVQQSRFVLDRKTQPVLSTDPLLALGMRGM